MSSEWEFTPADLAEECRRERKKREEVYQRQAIQYGNGALTPLQRRRIAMMEELANRMQAEVVEEQGDLFSAGGES